MEVVSALGNCLGTKLTYKSGLKKTDESWSQFGILKADCFPFPWAPETHVNRLINMCLEPTIWQLSQHLILKNLDPPYIVTAVQYLVAKPYFLNFYYYILVSLLKLLVDFYDLDTRLDGDREQYMIWTMEIFYK